eukprot:gene40795-50483_t
MNLDFLEAWKVAIHEVHVIIIQTGDPHRMIAIPDWLDYELYTKLDVIKAVGEKDSWIFDMDSDGPAAANFGFIVADRQFIYILDKDCVPINEHHGKQSDGFHLSGLFRSHANNLQRPSAPYYYNSADPYTSRDGTTSSTDYNRGHPYFLREGIQTAISIGSVRNH